MWTFEDWQRAALTCNGCGWSGDGGDARLMAISTFDYFLRCPRCDRVIDALRTPTIQEAREHWDELDEDTRLQIAVVEARHRERKEQRLERPDQLPDLDGDDLLLTWDMTDREGGDVVIRHGDRVVWREPTYYENFDRFEKVAGILGRKYGRRLIDVIPTETSMLYLYGDRISAADYVDAVRKRLRAAHASRDTD